MGRFVCRFWVELVLPLYSICAVFAYFRPGMLPNEFDQSALESAAVWLVWGMVAALSGILAISALFLSFYLLYSPFYLAGQVRQMAGPHKWVDRREFRFYLGCFVMLCLLAALAVTNPTVAGAAFIILSGSAQVVWRVLV
jgi:hypothetical protein